MGLARRIKRASDEKRLSGHRKRALRRKAFAKARDEIARMREQKIGPFAETGAIDTPSATA